MSVLPLGLRQFQTNIPDPGGSAIIGSTAGVVITGITTAGITEGDAVYISATNTVTKTDAEILDSSIKFGISEGVPGRIKISGIVANAKFTTDGGQPDNGARAYLANGSDDSNTGAGKFTATSPSQNAYQLPAVIIVDNSKYAADKTCKVLIDKQREIEMPTVFVPTSLTNNLAWYKFSDASTVDAVLDGDLIGSLTDKTTPQNNMTQTTGAKKPIYKLGFQNGLNIARFDGSDDFLTAGNDVAFRTDNFSIFFAAKHERIGTGPNKETFWASQCFRAATNQTGFRIFIDNQELQMDVAVNPTTLPVNHTTSGTAFPIDEWKIVSVIKTGTTGTFWINGTQVGTWNDFPASIEWIGGGASAPQTMIGATPQSGVPTNYLDGEAGEYIIYSDDKSSDRVNIENYLAQEWGIVF